jgi:hypothetical protein
VADRSSVSTQSRPWSADAISMTHIPQPPEDCRRPSDVGIIGRALSSSWRALGPVREQPTRVKINLIVLDSRRSRWSITSRDDRPSSDSRPLFCPVAAPERARTSLAGCHRGHRGRVWRNCRGVAGHGHRGQYDRARTDGTGGRGCHRSGSGAAVGRWPQAADGHQPCSADGPVGAG